MRLMEGEEVIHELRPAPAVLVIWLFSRCLPSLIAGLPIGIDTSAGASPVEVAVR